MKTSSAKAKGRRLSQLVKEVLIEWAPDLSEKDIQVTPSSVNGPDLYLSPRALEIYNYAIECKCQEKIQIWSAYEQAVGNALDNQIPILVFSRNRSRPLVCIDLDNFLKVSR